MNDEIFDMMIRDLLPEGSVVDNLFPVENLFSMPEHSDIVNINRQLESLTLENNTNSLRIEVERSKRQKMRATLRQIKHDIRSFCSEGAPPSRVINTLRENQEAVNYQLEGEIARLNTICYRSFSRMHQLLTFLLPRTNLAPDDQVEATYMLNEIAQTIHPFIVCYQPVYHG